MKNKNESEVQKFGNTVGLLKDDKVFRYMKHIVM